MLSAEEYCVHKAMSVGRAPVWKELACESAKKYMSTKAGALHATVAEVFLRIMCEHTLLLIICTVYLLLAPI